jgi:hypothetical protein
VCLVPFGVGTLINVRLLSVKHHKEHVKQTLDNSILWFIRDVNTDIQKGKSGKSCFRFVFTSTCCISRTIYRQHLKSRIIAIQSRIVNMYMIKHTHIHIEMRMRIYRIPPKPPAAAPMAPNRDASLGYFSWTCESD